MRGIYQITIERPDGSELVYVGSARIIERRQREHLGELIRGVHDNNHLQRAYDKYGLSKDGWFALLQEVPGDDPHELLRAEQFWFDRRVAELGRRNVANKMRPERNPLDDPEARERHRAVMESEEWRAKNAEAARKRSASPEWRVKNAEAVRKRAADPEWRAKTAASVTASNKARAKRYVVTTPDGDELEVYNLNAFCREEGLDQGSMVSVARGRYSHHKGYRVRYADEEDGYDEEA